MVRPAAFYENIFRDMGLGVVHSEDYPEYEAEPGLSIYQERVWLLQETEAKCYSEPSQQL